MTGFFTEGEIGNSLAESEGIKLIPSTTGEVLGAQFSQSFAENPASRLFRFVQRNLEANPITMSPEEANQEYGVPGRLTFDEPVSRTIARDLNEHHTNSAIREDVIERRQGGITTGGFARFGAGLAASILDPLNIASAFIPGVREARIAAALGAGAAGAGGRASVRALAGASSGFAGTVALEPLNYFLSQKDKDDYGMGDVLTSLAFGTILGGGLHTAIGAVRDRRGLPPWSPEMHEAAFRQSVAALSEGRPVHAAAAMEFTAARTARSELENWYSSKARVEADAERALAKLDTASQKTAAESEHLIGLRDEAQKIRAELADARSRLSQSGIDTETTTRLAEIDAELSGTIPRTRRAALEQERTMLMEGRDWTADDLEAGRTQAEIDGLAAVQARADRQVALAEGREARAAQAENKAEGIFNAQSAALAAREGIVRDLMERSIRRVAGAIGARLEDGEAAEFASRMATASREQYRGVIQDILRTLSNRAPAGPYLPEQVFVPPGAVVMERASAALRAREAKAERALADTLRGAPDPDIVAADRSAATLKAETPAVEGNVADDIVQAEKSVKELSETLRRADQAFAEQEAAAGRQPLKPDPALALADELGKEGEAMAKAYEAAAICNIGGR
jgi:hypothetical protein